MYGCFLCRGTRKQQKRTHVPLWVGEEKRCTEKIGKGSGPWPVRERVVVVSRRTDTLPFPAPAAFRLLFPYHLLIARASELNRSSKRARQVREQALSGASVVEAVQKRRQSLRRRTVETPYSRAGMRNAIGLPTSTVPWRID